MSKVKIKVERLRRQNGRREREEVPLTNFTVKTTIPHTHTHICFM